MLRFTCFALLASLAVGLELSASLSNHWESFKSKHNKDYDSNTEDKRKDIFKSNVEAVFSHNLQADLGQASYSLGINEHADLSHEEFQAKFLGLNYDGPTEPEEIIEAGGVLGEIPETKDWRNFDSAVKNQGSCGSCWTFATTGAIEAHYAIYKNQRVVLSEQNLVDCSNQSFFNFGCNGGNPNGAYRYIIRNGGIDADSCYKYEKKEGLCRYDESCKAATITGFKELPRNEMKLMEVLANVGPVAIGIDAGQRSFQLYKNGVYDDPNCLTKPNHAVLAVGYGVENGKKYYLVKNSWGGSWGERGYFKLAQVANRCGVVSMPSYPIVE